MGKTKLKILDFEHATGKKSGKRYTKFTTSNGNMNCFEEDIIAALIKEVGNEVNVDVVESNGFMNIRGYDPEGTTTGSVAINTPVVKVKSYEATKQDFEKNKQAGVATRYAVDLCIAGKVEKEQIKETAEILANNMKELAEEL